MFYWASTSQLSAPDAIRIGRLMPLLQQDFNGQLHVVRKGWDALLASNDFTDKWLVEVSIGKWVCRTCIGHLQNWKLHWIHRMSIYNPVIVHLPGLKTKLSGSKLLRQSQYSRWLQPVCQDGGTVGLSWLIGRDWWWVWCTQRLVKI